MMAMKVKFHFESVDNHSFFWYSIPVEIKVILHNSKKI